MRIRAHGCRNIYVELFGGLEAHLLGDGVRPLQGRVRWPTVLCTRRVSWRPMPARTTMEEKVLFPDHAFDLHEPLRFRLKGLGPGFHNVLQGDLDAPVNGPRGHQVIGAHIGKRDWHSSGYYRREDLRAVKPQ